MATFSSPQAIPRPDPNGPMSTTKTEIKTCPGCGAKLPDVALSICPYCVTPLGLAPKGDTEESPYAARIARLLAHETLSAVASSTPAEGPDFVRGGQVIFRGKLTISIGCLMLASTLITGAEVLSTLPVIGLAVILAGIVLMVQGKGVRTTALSNEMLSRPGVIIDRRSEITLEGMGGSTTYFFEIEFEGGLRGEFRWPGRGNNAEPYPSNLPGVAFTRGIELVHFQHIRV